MLCKACLHIEPLEARIAPAAAIFALSTVDGNNGFKISGVDAGDRAGRSVSHAGDVNGDGFDDVIIGAYRADTGGASYVVFGKENGFVANLDLSTLDGSNGFKLTGVAANDDSGRFVSAAGDVNHDGFGDLIVGAYNADPNGAASGASYIVFGKATGFAANLNLSTLTGTNGFKLSGVAAGDNSGISVGGAGDVNGDGFGDVLVGASNADPNGIDSGASYLVFGKATGFAANLNLSTLDGSNGFKLSGVAAGDLSGVSVGTAGDVNRDGFGDLIIGATGADPNGAASGASYVVFGKASGFVANLNLSTLDGSNGFKLSGVAAGDLSGVSVGDAGDVNRDGFGDLIVGAADADPNGDRSGASFVVFGRGSFAAELSLASLDGTNGFKLSGVTAGDRSGYSVSAASDVNGDGFDDVLIGTFRFFTGATGSSYLVFGKESGFGANLNLATLNGTTGFKISGAAGGDWSGSSLSAAGDLNDDGFGDLIIGAWGDDSKGTDAGATYVVFGSELGPLATVSVSDATIIEPVSGMANAAFTVSLSSSSAQTVSVQYATSDGTAAAPSDYTGAGVATLTFAPGETSKTVLVPVHANAPSEPDETFFVTLSNATNATILDGQGQGTIRDDTVPRTISVNDVTVIEGEIGTVQALFTVSLSRPSNQPVTVRYVTSAGSATELDDFSSVDNVLTFAPEEVNKTVAISVQGDTLPEGTEQFFLNLSAPTNAAILDGGAQGTILDASTSLAVSIGNVIIREGDSGSVQAVLTINLTRPSTQPIPVRYVSGGGNATAPDDYTPLDDTLTFAPGEVSKTVVVEVQGDTRAEATERFFLNLSSPTTVRIADAQARVVIADNDTAKDPGVFDIELLDGTNGFSLSGVAADDGSGHSVSDAGDVNGDGFDDVIVGAPYADPAGISSGASYVVFGKGEQFPPNLNLSMLDGSNGFTLSGLASSRSGYSVSGAGDVNGDRLDDIIVGAGTFNGGGYIVFGRTSGFPPNLNVSTLDGSNGFKLSGVASTVQVGFAVSAAGDVNKDGFGDVIIGSRGVDANGNRSGASYVVFGGANGFPANVNLSTLDGRNGFKLSGVASQDYAGEVSGAGDVNGDGFADLIVGAPRADINNSDAGASYVVFGKATPFPANFELSTVDGNNGFRLTGVSASESSGSSVSAAGDLNRDGFGDLIIGTGGGNSYVVFGKQNGFTPNLELSTLDGSNGFRLSASSGRIGDSVSGAGDINGDGFGDLITSGSGNGQIYVVFGKATGFPADLNVTTLTGLNGFRIAGAFGSSVSGAGDVNRDGFDDLIVGDRSADLNANDSGASYVVFGRGPDIMITDAVVAAEGDTGATAAVFTVTLANTSTRTVSVLVSTTDGTAAAGADYTALAGQLVEFAPGETTKAVTVSTLGDSVFELDETFSVILSAPTNATIGDGSGLGTIINDDLPPPTISIGNGSITEGDSGVKSLAFAVNLSRSSTQLISVRISTADGTAVADSDYTPIADQLVEFAPGETTKIVSIQVLGDATEEENQRFTVGISSPINSIITRATAFGTILNDDNLPPAPKPVGKIELGNLDSTLGFKIHGQPGAYSASSVSSAGDVNGDGFEDLLISAGSSAYLVFGKLNGFQAPFEVANVDGTNGFVMNGSLFGLRVGRGGDINNDGFDDILVGGVDGFQRSNAYVIFGHADSFTREIVLGNLDGVIGFQVQGGASGLKGGFGLSTAGDFNGDGLDDLLLGATDANATYLLFGQANGFPPLFDVANLNGLNGFRVDGGEGRFGTSAAAAGDVNGDGFSDIVIGAPSASSGSGDAAGAAYVVFGTAARMQPTFSVSNLNGLNGFKLVGTRESDNAGRSVSGAGDFNGDGFDDIIVGAPGDSYRNARSESYLIYGKQDGFAAITPLSQINGSNGFKMDGEAPNDYSGFSVSQAGDFNGDGFSDLLIAAPYADPHGSRSGRTYLVFGGSDEVSGGRLELAKLDGTRGIKISGGSARDESGMSVSSAGDFNGDGLKDILIGAPGADGSGEDSGVSYLIYGTLTQGASQLSFRFSDADGDKVTITTTKGSLSSSNFIFAPDGTLQKIDLAKDLRFVGANLTLIAQPTAQGGDSRVDVQFVDATNLDLGKVTISGNVGKIVAGDGDARRPALKALTVGSLGGTSTTGEPLVSDIAGSLGVLTVQRDVKDAVVNVREKLGKVLIRGSLIDSGVPAQGAQGKPTIGVFLNGGIPPVTASHAGAIFAPSIGSFTVIGNIDGGEVTAEARIKSVKVVGSLTSDDPLDPAVLRVGKGVGQVVIEGDVKNALILAGYNRELKPLNADASIGKVTVNGNWTASSIVAGIEDPNDNGFGVDDRVINRDTTKEVLSRIASVIIKGTAAGSSTLTDQSAITAQKIGALRIFGIKVPLTAGIDNVPLDSVNQNFRAVEI